MSSATLTTLPKERVGVLVMQNEPENRLSPDLLADMGAILDAVESDDAVRALVLTGGESKFFSNGLDLAVLMARLSDPAALASYLRQVNGLFHRVTLYPKPIVAAINGHAFGAGLFLAAHTDFRVMRADRGWICLPEVDINIPLLPGMIAICQAVLPPASFHRLYYTGKRFTGPEAVELGFAEAAVALEELLPRAVALATELGRKKTRTYAEMKRRIRAGVARTLVEDDPPEFMKTLAFSMG